MAAMRVGNAVRKPLWVALILALCAAWLLSGTLGAEQESATSIASRALAQEDAVVRVRTSRASEQSRTLKLRGRTYTRRAVTVLAETAGQVEERPVSRGEQVSAGDLLCRLEIKDRELRVLEARDAVALATLEHEGMLSLREQGLQRELSLAGAKAQLSAARRALVASEIELANTSIVAPFDGFVDETHAKVGDYLVTGKPCATILGLDPIYVRAAVTEQQYPQLRLGVEVQATLSTGAVAQGTLAFIGKQSTDATRTFPIEAAFPNPDSGIASGLSAEIEVPLSEELAHQVAVSHVVLNADGQLGVRTVDGQQRVRFYPVEVLGEDADGLWVSGLPAQVTLITVGQEFVSPGQRVEVQHEPASGAN